MVHTLQIGSVDSEVLWIALIGFSIVALLLVLLVFVVKIFGVVFAKAASANSNATSGKASTSTQKATDEELAAIAVALRLHTLARHDKESGVLTFSQQNSNSAWGAKVHGLRQMPQRK